MTATRALASLFCALSLGACASAPPPPPSSADRLNAEAVRRLSRGDGVGAEETARKALQEAMLTDDLRGQARALTNLGALALARGLVEDALRCFRSAVSLYRTAGVIDDGEVIALTNLGSALLAQGRVAEADATFADAIARALARGGASHMAASGRAATALARGDAREAAQLARRAADDAEAAHDMPAAAAAMAIEGQALATLGDLRAAHARLEKALDLDRRREDPLAVASDLRALADVAERQGDADAARAYRAREKGLTDTLDDRELARRPEEQHTSAPLLGRRTQ
jgi:tetratricopeptide (TPR) repeat protein